MSTFGSALGLHGASGETREVSLDTSDRELRRARNIPLPSQEGNEGVSFSLIAMLMYYPAYVLFRLLILLRSPVYYSLVYLLFLCLQWLTS